MSFNQQGVIIVQRQYLLSGKTDENARPLVENSQFVSLSGGVYEINEVVSVDIVRPTKNDLARQRFLKFGVKIRKLWRNLNLDVEYKL